LCVLFKERNFTEQSKIYDKAKPASIAKEMDRLGSGRVTHFEDPENKGLNQRVRTRSAHSASTTTVNEALLLHVVGWGVDDDEKGYDRKRHIHTAVQSNTSLT